MGFVCLDNFTGNKRIKYSAELSTCFERRAWGDFTRYCAKIFLKKCFDELGLYKIKVQIFPDNFRIKTLLKYAGFKYEATLPKETIRNNKLQDIEVYSLYKDYYYGG
jgi:RimJ/RimL family protein N-acetyltransferase